MNWKQLCLLAGFTILFLYTLLFLSLFYFFDPSRFFSYLTSPRVVHSIKLSIVAATVASLLSLTLAIPAGYSLSRFSFPGKSWINSVLEFPLVVSPAALGAMILIFFTTPLGDFLEKHTVSFVFTFYGILLAQFIATLGLSTRLVKAVFDEIPKRYEEVAQSLGASPFLAFLTVTLPLAKRGILVTAAITWAKALGEFGATITVAGSMAMKTETLPIAIFLHLGSADIEGAVVLIFLLLSLGLAILSLAKIFIKGYPHA